MYYKRSVKIAAPDETLISTEAICFTLFPYHFLCKHQTPTLPNCYVIWMAEQIGRSLVLFVQEEPLYKAPL